METLHQESEVRASSARLGKQLLATVEGEGKQWIVLAAPPGYGKTSLLQRCAQKRGVYASLESCELHPKLAYQAIATQVTRGRPDLSEGSHLEQILNLEDITLWLDNVDACQESGVLETLLGELARNAPKSLKVAFALRHPPSETLLKSLDGTTTVFTANELALSTEEVAELLARQAKRSPKPWTVTSVLEQTWGWPSLTEELIQSMGDSPIDAMYRPDNSPVKGFELVKDVLSSLPSRCVYFTKVASIPQTLDAASIEALSGSSPESASRVAKPGLLRLPTTEIPAYLETLEQYQLIRPLSDKSPKAAPSFTFPPRFRRMLNAQLKSDEQGAFRAANRGIAHQMLRQPHDDPTRVARHLMAAEDWSQLLSIIRVHYADIPPRHRREVLEWLQATDAHFAKLPCWASIVLAIELTRAGNPVEALREIDRAKSSLQQDATEAELPMLQAALWTARAEAHLLRGHASDARTYSKRAHEILASLNEAVTAPPFTHAHLLTRVGRLETKLHSSFESPPPTATEGILATLEDAYESGNCAATARAYLALSNQPELKSAAVGNLKLALRLAETSQDLPLVAEIQCQLATAYAENGHTAQLSAALATAHAAVYEAFRPEQHLVASYVLAAAKVSRAQNKIKGAKKHLAQARELLLKSNAFSAVTRVDWQLADIAHEAFLSETSDNPSDVYQHVRDAVVQAHKATPRRPFSDSENHLVMAAATFGPPELSEFLKELGYPAREPEDTPQNCAWWATYARYATARYAFVAFNRSGQTRLTEEMAEELTDSLSTGALLVHLPELRMINFGKKVPLGQKRVILPLLSEFMENHDRDYTMAELANMVWGVPKLTDMMKTKVKVAISRLRSLLGKERSYVVTGRRDGQVTYALDPELPFCLIKAPHADPAQDVDA